MSSHTRIDDSIEGKHVINADGEEVGIVSGARGDVAYVDPDPGISDTVKSMLGWDHVEEDDYTLRRENIERITDDEVHLTRGSR
jgi:hypothetical protein